MGVGTRLDARSPGEPGGAALFGDADIVAAYACLVDHLTAQDAVRPVDAIFCFGSRDLAVPARAAALHTAGVSALIVVTGGPHTAGSCEADVFAEVLIELGVPSGHIVRERRSRNTGENVLMGLAALHEQVGLPRSLASVSWPLASRRCLATFARHEPTIDVVAAPAMHRRPIAQQCTPRTVDRALAEWSRLDRYADDGLIARNEAPSQVHQAAALLQSAMKPR